MKKRLFNEEAVLTKAGLRLSAQVYAALEPVIARAMKRYDKADVLHLVHEMPVSISLKFCYFPRVKRGKKVRK